MPPFLILAVCAFCSGFSLRLADPLVLPVALHFGVPAATAALLNTAYALPYALAQPFLGALGDRYGKPRCIQVCIAGLTVMLALGTFATSFSLLLATRVVAGVFAGGLIPLVLAGLGDRYDMSERQVMIGRMLFATITGQMLGSAVSGALNHALGWRSALALAALLAVVGTMLAWRGLPAAADAAGAPSLRAGYARIFANRKAPWLYLSVVLEGALIFGVFPYVGQLLVERTGVDAAGVSVETGLVLGAFGIGGLGYALGVRRVVGALGVRRMCLVASLTLTACYGALGLLQMWWLYAAALAAAGFCFYMLHNSLQTVATEIAPTARGSAVALFAAGFFIGQGLGPLLFGALAHRAGFGVALAALGLGFIGLGQMVVRRVVD